MMKAFYSLFIFVLVVNIHSSIAQNNSAYDLFTDTLLIINSKTIDTDRLLMKRHELVDADSIRVNQKGMFVKSFTLTAFALGKSVELVSDQAVLTKAMKDEILNEQAKYKFVSLKNIILHTKDGREVQPSTKNVKVIFE